MGETRLYDHKLIPSDHILCLKETCDFLISWLWTLPIWKYEVSEKLKHLFLIPSQWVFQLLLTGFQNWAYFLRGGGISRCLFGWLFGYRTSVLPEASGGSPSPQGKTPSVQWMPKANKKTHGLCFSLHLHTEWSLRFGSTSLFHLHCKEVLTVVHWNSVGVNGFLSK